MNAPLVPYWWLVGLGILSSRSPNEIQWQSEDFSQIVIQVSKHSTVSSDHQPASSSLEIQGQAEVALPATQEVKLVAKVTAGLPDCLL